MSILLKGLAWWVTNYNMHAVHWRMREKEKNKMAAEMIVLKVKEFTVAS